MTGDPSGAPTFHRDRTTWLAYLALGYFAYLETILGPLMPFLQGELAFSYTVASLHFGAFALGVICMGVIGPEVTRRLGRRRAFWGGAGGMALGATMLVAPSWVGGTIAGAGLMGFAGTLLLVVVQAVLSDHHGPLRTIAFAESNVVAGVCAILATVAVGSLARTALGWRAAAWLAVAVFVAFALLFATVRLTDSAGSGRGSQELLHSKLPARFWVFWTVMLLGSSVEWCIVFWGATFLEQGIGIAKAAAAATMSLFFVGIVTGRFAGSRLARSAGSGALLSLAQAVTLVGFPLFWLAPLGPLNAVGLFVAGCGVGNFYPMTLATAAGAAPHIPDLVSARLTLAMGLAALLAPVALGWLSDRIAIAQAYAIVLPLLLGAVLLTAADRVRQRRAAQAPAG